MLLIPLQSGSSGNCLYVESDGVRLLFDSGLSALQVRQRLAEHGKDAEGAAALFISHDHSDHVRCASVVSKKLGVPLHITEKTYRASAKALGDTRGLDVEHFRAGTSVKVGHVTVETIATPHDAADGVVFVVDDGRHRLGICTDVGHVFGDLKCVAASVDGLFLESNYDPAMLARGPYPRFLKARISGPRGHISNREAADLVADHAGSRLRWLCLAHLSDKNNTPAKAMAVARKALGKELPIHLTSREHATDAVELAEGSKPKVPASQLTFEF